MLLYFFEPNNMNDTQTIQSKIYELSHSRSQNVTLNKSGSNIKYLPYAFTELGVAMFSSVLKSEAAINVNREVSRTTYYHRFSENSPFFLDYTFSNMVIKSYSLCEWNKEVSDHVAQMIEV